MTQGKRTVETKTALEIVSEKLNLGLDQTGELYIKIREKDPRTAVEMRAILDEMFGEGNSRMLSTEELIRIVQELEEENVGYPDPTEREDESDDDWK